jgi:hypothetical protein
MAVNRASNSRFMGWDRCAAAQPEIRRQLDISNFTATFQSCPMLLSRVQRATSIIIERIVDSDYELWKVASAFWDAIALILPVRFVSTMAFRHAVSAALSTRLQARRPKNWSFTAHPFAKREEGLGAG